MKQRFSARISQEDECYIAQCVQVDVASQGATEEEALDTIYVTLSNSTSHRL